MLTWRPLACTGYLSNCLLFLDVDKDQQHTTEVDAAGERRGRQPPPLPRAPSPVTSWVDAAGGLLSVPPLPLQPASHGFKQEAH
jgi:hypothetical protein